MIPQPEIDGSLHTPGGQRRSGKTIHLVLIALDIGTDAAHHKLEARLLVVAVLVIDLLARPLGDPARVVDLTAKPRRLPMLVETKTGNGIGIPFQSQESLHRGPKAISMHRKHDALNTAIVVAQYIGLVVLHHPVDAGRIMIEAD